MMEKSLFNLLFLFSLALFTCLAVQVLVVDGWEDEYGNKISDVNLLAPAYNVTLLVSNWDESSYLGGLNVFVYDSNESLIFAGVTDAFGSLYLTLKEGFYTVVIKSDERVVGYQRINVTKSGTIKIRAWAFTLRITCIDRESRFVDGAIVHLYNRMIIFDANATNKDFKANITEQKVCSVKTDKNGTAIFNNIWNGTYRIVVEHGRIIGEKIIDVNKSENLTLICNRVSLKIKIYTSTVLRKPLSNATILLQDSIGRIFAKEVTDEEGVVYFNNVYGDNYTVFVDWMGFEVFSGTINANVERDLEFEVSVFSVTIRVVDAFGNALPNSRVTIKRIVGRVVVKTLELEADERGIVSVMLPSGYYEFSCSGGIYTGSIIANIFSNYSGTISCGIHPNIFTLAFVVSVPLLLFSLLLERQKIRKPLEYRRYQNILLRLENLYSSGLVEYKIYRKLREEYETKLMELGGRRRR
ncbi:MAG: hypothetical protein QW782_04645 [Candidatus Bathyarchaeia archaeon]